jgi:uncharacterized protein (TIGR02265 family)
MAEEQPQIVAQVVLAYLAEVEQLQLLDKIGARAGIELRQVLAKRPLPVAWVDARVMAQLADAVVAVAGEDALSKISHAAMRRAVGPLFGNVSRVSIAILGANPHRLFKSYGTGTSLTLRGFSFGYTQDSDTSGRMKIAVTAKLSPSYWITWEGPLAYILEQCGFTGSVRRDQVDATSGTFRVQWTR